MYDFYPEWGPARNRDEREAQTVRRPRYWTTTLDGVAGAAAEARDGELSRPDDN